MGAGTSGAGLWGALSIPPCCWRFCWAGRRRGQASSSGVSGGATSCVWRSNELGTGGRWSPSPSLDLTTLRPCAGGDIWGFGCQRVMGKEEVRQREGCRSIHRFPLVCSMTRSTQPLPSPSPWGSHLSNAEGSRRVSSPPPILFCFVFLLSEA